MLPQACGGTLAGRSEIGPASAGAANIDGLSTAISSIDRTLDVSPHGGALLPAARRARWWVEALTIAWLCWVYDWITNLAPLRLGVALTHGRDILSAEQALGIDPERSLDRWLAARHAIGVAVSYYYDNAHFVVTLGLLAYLWWRRADIYRPLRTSLVLINLAGFVVFWRYPVAPPRMLGGFSDVVADTHTFGSWHTGSLASHANQLAAMPSLHLAWAVWCTVAVWRMTSRRAWRALAAVYPLLTTFVVMATGNHYLLDVLAGALLAALVIAAVWATPRALARSRRTAPPPAGASAA